MAELTDLETIVKDYAWNTFSRVSEKKLDYKEARIDIDWSRTKFVASKPTFGSVGMEDLPTAQEIYRSTYVNGTNEDQEHSISMQRSTKSTCKAYVTKGYTKGVNVGLKLAVPGDVANLTTAFGYSVNITDNSEESKEETMTWGSDCKVRVPKQKKVTANISVTEKEYNAAFQMKTTIYGTVHVAIHNRIDDRLVQSIDAPFVEIMRWYCKNNGFGGCTIKGKEVTWDVTGNCYFRFGVEQRVETQPSRQI
ncbi:uncharacterized protein LOC133191345 [Saccostrea echinata]|uniref:uncharacterized protein LOC133191345 n=1 Tax=Saccostrea echinata TaxID=191078 RepID=UPI002A81F5AE|nr:uncharacterized protein LOC133191345 [Saccostrea echinata]